MLLYAELTGDFEELKRFVQWLEQRKQILDELDRINGMAKKATVASGIALYQLLPYHLSQLHNPT